MPVTDIQSQIVKYLTDVHSTEEDAVTQLRTGAGAVEDPRLADVLKAHLTETEEHERLIRERLDQLDASPSTLKDIAQKGVAAVTGVIAGAAPDTTGKIAIQAYAFEHLEIASYRMLRAVALHGGDHTTARLAERISKTRKLPLRNSTNCSTRQHSWGCPKPPEQRRHDRLSPRGLATANDTEHPYRRRRTGRRPSRTVFQDVRG